MKLLLTSSTLAGWLYAVVTVTLFSPAASAFTSCPPTVLVVLPSGGIAPLHCASGHYTITLSGLGALNLSSDAVDRIARANIAVDGEENHWAGWSGVHACNGGGITNPLFQWRTNIPGPYSPEQHFDRVGSTIADHNRAFQVALAYVWTERSNFVNFLRQAKSCSDVAIALDELGKALHALQDAYSHSNYIVTDAATRAAFDAALQNVGILSSLPPGILLTGYDASDPNNPESPAADSYDHCTHSKDYPGKNQDSTPAAYSLAATAASGATANFVTNLITQISATDWQKVATFVECKPTCVAYYAGTTLTLCSTAQSNNQIITSGDPNDKTGSQGIGGQQYISGTTPLRYAIFFGNEPTATAPAQTVTITDPLPTTTANLATLSLGPISFGTWFLVPPSGSTSYSTTVDLRPQTNLLVGISASLDSNSGKVSWKFTSLDPITGQPTTVPTAGFLPPGGNGSVFFTVVPKPGLSTGTQVQNQGTVVFDVNAPINTPTWINTLDNTPPTGAVSALTATQNSSSFSVNWSATDVGSGVQSYSVFVSDNGSPFAAWLTNVIQTSALYHGTVGHIYGFYSIAQDLVGNTQANKNVADATTTVSPSPTCASNYSDQVAVSPGGFRYNNSTKQFVQTVTLTGTSNSSLSGPISLVLDALSSNATLANGNGVTACSFPSGSPYINLNLGTSGVLASGQSVSLMLQFNDPSMAGITFTPRVLAGSLGR